MYVKDAASTGVPDTPVNANELALYPNPTRDLFTIQTGRPGEYSVEIISMNGQVLQRDEFIGTTHQIDLSSFQKGVYFITIRSEDFVRTKKIIKL